MCRRHDGQNDEMSSLEKVEAAIRAAGSYVIPTDDLRPRILEAAREYCGHRRTERRLIGCVLTTIFLWALCIQFVDEVDVPRTSMMAPSSVELQQRALEIAADTGFGPTWGLAEAFANLRSAQAELLGNFRQRQ